MKREFMVERQGRWFVLYAGLLDEAHAQGLKSIRTQLLQVPSPENGQVAICWAEVTTERGTFTGVGDASPENVARLMLPHTIRMAETRAKARALRDSINVGVTALEELAELEEASESANGPAHAREAHRAEAARPEEPAPRPVARVAEVRTDELGPRPNGARPPVAPAQPAAPPPAINGQATFSQVQAIYTIGRKVLGLAEGQMDEKTMALYGVPPAELSRRQASDLITSLKAREAAAKEATGIGKEAGAKEAVGRDVAG